MRRYGKIFLLHVLPSAPHRCIVNAQITRYTAIGHSGKIAVEHLLFAFCEPHLARYILCLGLSGVYVVDCFDMIFVFYAIIEPCDIAVFRSEMFEDISVCTPETCLAEAYLSSVFILAKRACQCFAYMRA